MDDKIRNTGALRGGSESVQMSLPYRKSERGIIACSDNITFMERLPDAMFKLIVTSPPYNLGKPYEQRSGLDEYLAMQERVIGECVRLLHDRGSICWQVGNYVDNGEIVPIDTLLYPLFRAHGAEVAQSHHLAFRPRTPLQEQALRAL